MVLLDKFPHPLAAIIALGDAIKDIGAIETVNEALRALEVELRFDFAEGAPVGRCRQRNARNPGKTLMQACQVLVIGPEVVAPLRYAVRLVDGEQGEATLAEQLQKIIAKRPFRRHVEQVDIASQDLSPGLELLLGRLRGIEKRSLDTQLRKRVDLVLHQRNQR